MTGVGGGLAVHTKSNVVSFRRDCMSKSMVACRGSKRPEARDAELSQLARKAQVTDTYWGC